MVIFHSYVNVYQRVPTTVAPWGVNGMTHPHICVLLKGRAMTWICLRWSQVVDFLETQFSTQQNHSITI